MVLNKTLEGILLGALALGIIIPTGCSREQQAKNEQTTPLEQPENISVEGYMGLYAKMLKEKGKFEHEKARDFEKRLIFLEKRIKGIDFTKSDKEVEEQFRSLGYVNFNLNGRRIGKILEDTKFLDTTWGNNKEVKYIEYSSLGDKSNNGKDLLIAYVRDGTIYADRRAMEDSALRFYEKGKILEDSKERNFGDEMTYLHYKKFMDQLKNVSSEKKDFVNLFCKNLKARIKVHEPRHLGLEGEVEAILTELAYIPNHGTLTTMDAASKGIFFSNQYSPYVSASKEIFPFFEKEGYSKKKLSKTPLKKIGDVAKKIYLKNYSKK